jgi:transcriptional regulator with XRE-family HTH domain
MGSSSSESARIVETLKRVLKARGLTYRELGRRIALSEPSVKRVLARATISLDRLERMCAAVGISVQELVRLAGEGTAEGSVQLSLEQERALAADPRLLACYHLIANGRTGREVMNELDVEEASVRRWLVRLKALGLVELTGNLKARALASTAVAWRAEGPVRRMYESQARAEFLRPAFGGTEEALHMRTAELSAASLRVLLRKCERLAMEFRDLAELDRALEAEEKRNVGMLLAVRPWVFSVFAGLRRRR